MSAQKNRPFSFLFLFLLVFSFPKFALSRNAWENYRDSATAALAAHDTLKGLEYLTKATEAHPNLALLDEEAYDRDFLISEDLAELFDRQGELLASLGQHNEAATSFTYSLYFYDMNAPVWYRRACAWRELEMWDGVLQDLDEALFLDSALHEGLRLRATVHMHNGAWADSIEDLSRAIRIAEEIPAACPEYYEARSAAWKSAGDEKKAAADREAALRMREEE